MSTKLAKPCVLIILALALAACSTTSAQTATDVPTIEYPLPTFPAPTEIIVSPEPTRETTVWPVFAPLQVPAPDGFAAYNFNPVNASLTLFDLQGQSIAVLSLPPMVSLIKIAGGLPAGAVTVPLVYFELEQNALVLDQGGSVSKLVDVPHFVALAAAVGQPVLAYSSIEYLNDGATTSSHLYVGTLQALSSALPALSVADTESYAIVPLAVRSEAGQPVGVWYTWEPQGIGDTAFAPRSGLYYLELANGTNHEILGRGVNPSAVSPDQVWLAFTTAVVSPLNIRDLTSGREVTFPLLADSDRGAGNAFFAPDSQHVAWLEAGGTLAADPPTFHVTIRIATTAGQVIADVPGETVIDFAGSGGEAVNVRPVGWLDKQTLILQVYSTYASSLLRVNLDGSGLDHLAPGSLAELLYP